MIKFQSTPTKALLSAGLFSVCLVTTTPQKAVAKTVSLQDPLTTVATAPSLQQTLPSDMVIRPESYKAEKHVQQEVAFLSPFRWYRRVRRIFG